MNTDPVAEAWVSEYDERAVDEEMKNNDDGLNKRQFA